MNVKKNYESQAQKLKDRKINMNAYGGTFGSKGTLIRAERSVLFEKVLT